MAAYVSAFAREVYAGEERYLKGERLRSGGNLACKTIHLPMPKLHLD